jgi:hypothetical protein
MAIGKRCSMTHHSTQKEDSMDLETFKKSFYFKVVCIIIKIII